jgi:Domain of unknown function (DUF4145)
MSMLVADCPRCGAKAHTLDVHAQQYRFQEHKWQNWYEVFAVCRNCHASSVWLIGLKDYNAREEFYGGRKIADFKDSLNPHFVIKRHIGLRDNIATRPPEHLPKEIENAFAEGATCLSVGCYNAAATMFRLCVDLVTSPLLPDPGNDQEVQPNGKQRRDLGLRLAWLFEKGKLPLELRELAKCIREDANDGAHAGSLTKADAEDVLDFTEALLERLVTEPKRLEIAQQRRDLRRGKS